MIILAANSTFRSLIFKIYGFFSKKTKKQKNNGKYKLEKMEKIDIKIKKN